MNSKCLFEFEQAFAVRARHRDELSAQARDVSQVFGPPLRALFAIRAAFEMSETATPVERALDSPFPGFKNIDALDESHDVDLMWSAPETYGDWPGEVVGHEAHLSEAEVAKGGQQRVGIGQPNRSADRPLAALSWFGLQSRSESPPTAARRPESRPLAGRISAMFTNFISVSVFLDRPSP